MEQSFVGIDVCKERLEVAVRGSTMAKPAFHVSNTDGGCKSLVAKLVKHEVAKVVLEATGGYERKVRGHLGEAGIPVTVLNPQRARAFAQFKGKLSKTDKVDAATLAEIAERGELDPTPPPDVHLERLTALVTRREQVVGMLTMEKNRLGRGSEATEPWIKQNVAALTDQLKRLNGEIAATVKGNPAWHENDRLLQSVKGIGPVTSAAILAHLPEIGKISHKKLAALVGRGSLRCRQWVSIRSPLHPWRQSQRSTRALHGSHLGLSCRGSGQILLSSSAATGKAAESSDRGRPAQAASYGQRGRA